MSEIQEGFSTEAAPAAPTLSWADAVAKAAKAEPPPDKPAADKPARAATPKRGEGGRFASEGDAAKPTEEAEPPAAKDADDDGAKPERVSVSERAKFREERRAWRGKAEAAARELAAREAALAAREAEAAELLEAKRARDPLAILKATGMTKEEWAKLTLRRFSDPVEAAKEEVARLREEMTAKERAAQERAAQAEERARFEGFVSQARAKLGETHPGLDRSPNVVRAVVAELAADDGLTWEEAVEVVTAKVLRPEYEALHAHFSRSAAPATRAQEEPAKPPPRRGITPAAAHDARGGKPEKRSAMPEWAEVLARARVHGG